MNRFLRPRQDIFLFYPDATKAKCCRIVLTFAVRSGQCVMSTMTRGIGSRVTFEGPSECYFRCRVLAEKQQLPFIQVLVRSWPGLELTIPIELPLLF